MSKKKMYSLRDTKSGVYGQPSFHVNEMVALRSLSDLINGEDSTPALHPGDFDLYSVGVWDDESGLFDLDDAPNHVINCSNLVKSKE